MPTATVGFVPPTSPERSVWTGAITVSVPTPPLPSARRAVARAQADVFTVSRSDVGAPEEQIRRLEALLNAGTVRARTPAESKSAVIPSLVELIDSSALDNGSLESIFGAFTRNRQLLPRLAELESTGHLTHLIQQMRRYQGLKELRLAVGDPSVGVPALCRLLRREWWVFGGHLVPWIGEEITPGGGDNDLIAMLRYDSAIHVVIVAPPAVPDLVTAVEGGGYALSPLVAAAEARARGLVRALDDREEQVSDRLRIEYRRAFVTILIGHPDHVPDLDPRLVREEIRVRNTFAAGILVTTYEELLNVAEMTLAGAGEDVQEP